MLRELPGAELIAPERDFRWRGGRITRLEGFTDAVFAFAVTLLVVSLEVPRTFADLLSVMKGFVAFGLCFAILTWLWYHHYLFSRRYGLQTPYVIALNLLLLFVVLFYVYPLKFLFTLLVGGVSGGRTAPVPSLEAMIADSQIPQLFLIYCAGSTAVFVILGLLYQHAWRVRDALQLDEMEQLRTAQTRLQHFCFAAVGVLVALAALLLPTRLAGQAGFLFFLNGVVGFVVPWIYGRRARAIQARTGSAPSQELAAPAGATAAAQPTAADPRPASTAGERPP